MSLLLFSGAFNPASLFSGGEDGVWYDPNDLSTLYQDSAGTIAVTGVGDPVGRMEDKSGNDNHVTQSTSSARPVLRQEASGRYYLEFDGTDDGMETVNGVLNDPEVSVVCAFKDTNTTTGVIWALPHAPNSHPDPFYRFMLFQFNNRYNIRVNGVTATNAATFPINKVVITLANKLGSPRENGVPISDTHSTDDLTYPNTVPFLLAQNSAGLENSAMNFYGFVGVGKALSTIEINQTEKYLAGKSGVLL